jgi:hypothetical protein
VLGTNLGPTWGLAGAYPNNAMQPRPAQADVSFGPSRACENRSTPSRLDVGAEAGGREFHVSWQGCGGVAAFCDFEILGASAERREVERRRSVSAKRVREPLARAMSKT